MNTLKDKHLQRIIKINWRILYLQYQNFPYCLFCWQWTLIWHVLLQLQIHKKLSIRLTIYKILCYYIIRFISKTFIRYGLYFESKVKIRKVFEWNWWHSYLILFCWHLYHLSIFIWLVEIFNTCNLWDLTLRYNRITNRLKSLKLYF